MGAFGTGGDGRRGCAINAALNADAPSKRGARADTGEIAVNSISLFGANPTVRTCLEILLGLSALSSASALPEWQWQFSRPRAVSVGVPVSGLLALAMASTMAAIMQPELFAAAFGVI
jgi:hypothetical protein